MTGRATDPLRWLVAGLVLVCLAVVVRSAWISEDAFITLRTVDNFVHGRGLVWNVDERVQTYTHPLWMFLLSGVYAVTGEPFHSTLALSLGVTTLFLVTFVRLHGASRLSLVVVLCGLLVSKAFVDFSTSGLENPLTHLFLCLGYAAFWDGADDERTLRRVGFIAALAAVNRLDTILLFLPPLAVVWLRASRSLGWRRSLFVSLGAFTPLFAWLLFALFYYGFFLPNTSYAKLSTGVAVLDYLHQGMWYMGVTASVDPITVLVVLAAVVLGCLPGARSLLPAVAAITLYLVYVLRVGGDFMVGRFLTPPLVLGCLVIARSPLRSPRLAAVLAATIVGTGLLMPRSPLRSGPDYGPEVADPGLPMGIRDVRSFNYRYTGLLRSGRERDIDHPRALSGLELRAEVGEARRVLRVNATGVFGFFAGPNVIIVDELGLGDPLLARLPIPNPNHWRIAHFEREIPAGYMQTRYTGENGIRHPELAAYYDRLRTVTSGPLVSRARMGAIGGFLLGRYAASRRAYVERLERMHRAR